MPAISDDVVIAGIGETPVGRLPGWNSVQIQALAVRQALHDAGLTIRDVDGLINLDPYATPSSMFAITLGEYLGATLSFASTVDVGGAVSGMTMLQQAVWAISAGYCQIAVVVYGENTLTGRPKEVHGMSTAKTQVGGEEWEEPFGVEGMVIPYALVAQRYLHEYGASPSDFGAVAVATRGHALLNDNALMKKPMTLGDHAASRMISSPLRLLDCSIVSDGGGALVLTSRKRAQRLGAKMVRMRSMAMRMTHNSVAQQPNIGALGMRAAAAEAFEAAGIGPGDVDIALLHDAFTVSVLLTIEAMGFCPAGEGGNYMRSGAGSLGGRCPVNTHGGLLSQAHIGGMLHLVEAARQLRGHAGRRQVSDARLGVVSGNGGVFSVCGAMVLEKV